MRRTIHGATGALLLAALLAPATLRAQDATQERVKEPITEAPGRNDTLRAAFAAVGQKVAPHVVRITRNGSHVAYGVAVEGGIITCDGALGGRDSGLRVQGQGFDLAARIASRDAKNDVALLRVEGAGPAPLAFGSSKDLAIGQFVITVGTEATPLCVGVVSAKDRKVEPSEQQQNILMGLFSDGNEGHKRHYPKVLQHDGPVAPEHFGSPLVDGAGRLVGINVAAPYRGSSHAVGVDELRALLGDLRAAGARPWLGVSVAPATADRLAGDHRCGLLVSDVAGPAQQGGVKPDDVIVAIDGEPFASIDAFAAKVATKKPGDTITLRVLRGRAAIVVDVPVVLGER